MYKVSVARHITKVVLFVRPGEGQIYTVGMMDRHRVLSTKLPVIPGKTKSSKAIVNAIAKMFGEFIVHPKNVKEKLTDHGD